MKVVAPQSQHTKDDGEVPGAGHQGITLGALLPRPKHSGRSLLSAGYMMPQDVLCARDCGNIHTSSCPYFIPSILLSLCLSIPLAIPPSLTLHILLPSPQAACTLPALLPFLVQEQVLSASHSTGSTPLGEQGWLSCCHLHQNSLPAPQHSAHNLLDFFPPFLLACALL